MLDSGQGVLWFKFFILFVPNKCYITMTKQLKFGLIIPKNRFPEVNIPLYVFFGIFQASRDMSGFQ
uniref:Uncharacterized protein n=1 Tax=Lepeophtheirus salmonis TaxID=72036 RepID=A0A0K2TDJ9_LEPSM